MGGGLTTDHTTEPQPEQNRNQNAANVSASIEPGHVNHRGCMHDAGTTRPSRDAAAYLEIAWPEFRCNSYSLYRLNHTTPLAANVPTNNHNTTTKAHGVTSQFIHMTTTTTTLLMHSLFRGTRGPLSSWIYANRLFAHSRACAINFRLPKQALAHSPLFIVPQGVRRDV